MIKHHVMNKKLYKKISIIVPVYNEQNTIRQVVDLIKKADTLGLEKEIVVVDDGSTDKTPEKIRNFKSEFIKVFSLKKNKGKGAAVRYGFKKARGDILLIQDADFEYSPQDYPSLLRPILEGKADVVYGSRFISDKPHRIMYFWHYVGNFMVTLVSNIFSDLNLSDMETGYKVFTRQVIDEFLEKLTSDRFGFEPEVTALIGKLSKKGKCRIYETGISYTGRTYEQGKKITWKDGILALWYAVKFNLLR